MTLTDLKPDAGSPVPLYHQLAESLRYHIATGAIRIGATLPPLRDAAQLWGVNLHTVRRAYSELASAGIVETRAPQGTRVLPVAGGRAADRGIAAGPARGGSRSAFLERVIGEARERHGLTLQGLLALLAHRNAPVPGVAHAPVYVAECSRTQSEDLAGQLSRRWNVHAVAWPIDRDAPPADGPVIATYFHYNDLRLRWPERFADIRFVAITPDPSLPSRLLPRQPAGTARRPRAGRTPAGRGGTAALRARVPVLLCERDASMLRNIAADVSRILPADRFRVTTRLVRRPGDLLAGLRGADRVLVAPRVWGGLPETTRRDPRVHELRYVFDPDGLDAIGRDLGWAVPLEE